jgi:hypothetical protein
VAESRIETNFGGIPIIIRDDMPAGCMVVVSGDGRQVIPIVNLDIEVDSTLHRRFDDNGPEKIMIGDTKVTGTLIAKFDSKELYESFIAPMKSVGRLAMEAMVRLGDAYSRTGQLNRSGRKQWRKDRKQITASLRRMEARGLREFSGERSF